MLTKLIISYALTFAISYYGATYSKRFALYLVKRTAKRAWEKATCKAIIDSFKTIKAYS